MPTSGGTPQSLIVRYPAASFIVSSTVLAFFSLSPTPPLIGVVLLVTAVRLSAWSFVPRPGGYAKGALQAVFIALSTGAAHLAPSVEALSTPSLAIVAISVISFFVSSLAVGLVFIGSKLGYTGNTNWSRLTVFPALWASAWAFMSQVSPVGQLITWSPVQGLGPYEWTRRVFGQWGIDWVVAAWAVLASEVVGDWLVGQDDQTEEALVDTEPLLGEEYHAPSYGTIAAPAAPRPKQSLSRSRSMAVLTGVLVLLMSPTYVFPVTPVPRVSVHTTSFGVACALPIPQKSGDGTGNPTLKDYIGETKKLQSSANVILWPESAVRFDSAEEREHAFKHIQNVTNGGKYVGVSFEDFAPGEPGKRRNGFALISNSGPPVLEYYKRNLVPVAESFSFKAGTEAPTVFTMQLPKPKDWKGSPWSKTGNTRPIPMTASICLDFAHTSSFASLDTHPALILAPARTWHESVGLAMWEQAKLRAAETGATVLWCDGGQGGLGGIADVRYSEIVQVGAGSWSKTIGIPYPFDERRTLYMSGGQGAAFAAVWVIALVGYLVEKLAGGLAPAGGAQLLLGGRRVAQLVIGRIKGSRAKQNAQQPNLLDI